MGVAVPTHLLVHSHVTVKEQATQDRHVQVWVICVFQYLHYSMNHTLFYKSALVYTDMKLFTLCSLLPCLILITMKNPPGQNHHETRHYHVSPFQMNFPSNKCFLPTKFCFSVSHMKEPFHKIMQPGLVCSNAGYICLNFKAIFNHLKILQILHSVRSHFTKAIIFTLSSVLILTSEL